MPKYLFKANLTAEGVRGVIKEGGSARREVVEGMITSAGGTLESFHFAFGGTDVFLIADLPDNQAAAAVSLTVSSSGVIGVDTVVLLTPEEMDEATKRKVEFRPPGA